ncbi:hypothetical protein PVAND_015362 [Polypedilum vanderplanki]|uniref:Uncharacterized protein n=1 Tax=Polypedilum vanderplanki TaxID=319348 RepID=A0A9J6BC18_POLVA|nr:hypothetical protein PVAND_015362 [Polypedilum vanderplanki]
MAKFYLYFLVIFSAIKFSRPLTLDCQFQTNNLKNLGSLYTCLVDNVFPLFGNIVTNISGTHQDGHNNGNVRVVKIQNSQFLNAIPRNVRSFFPNVIGISLERTSIDKLDGDELNEYGEQLVWFALTFSFLVEVPSNFFLHTPKVVNVWFSNNQIERVGNDLFTPLNTNELKIVDFLLNRCISRLAETTPNIVALIDDLRRECPLDTGTTTTTENSSNFIGNYKTLNILMFLFEIRKLLESKIL